MAYTEIDEVELLNLRKQNATVQKLWADPKSRRKIQEAIKATDPTASFPELDAEEAVRAPVTALESEVNALKKQLADEAAERDKRQKLESLSNTMDKGFAKLRREGWTDEGITAVQKLMEEKGTTDVEMAASYYEKQNPPQSPATPRGVGGWDFVGQVQDGEADLKALLDSRGNNEALVDKMARETLNEARGASRR